MACAAWCTSPGRHALAVLVFVVRFPLTSAFEFPQALAKSSGNVGELLPTEEKQGEQEKK
jgi:hypothetical protein